jgi:glycosyltransferase involved in cell wall biosynthesis
VSPLRVFWVTNIPAPYRNHRYRRMREVFPSLGLQFEVLYMAWSEPDRHWRFAPGDLDHPHHVYRGLHLPGLGSGLHLTPGLLWRLLRDPREVVVVGGWGSPTAALAPWLAAGRPLRVLESESNLQSGQFTSPLARRIKGRLVSRYEAFVVPGGRARALLEWLAPDVAARPFVEFPNLVDEEVFERGTASLRGRRAELRRELGVPEGVALWVCPARLETFKGVHLLLPLLRDLQGIELWVAGEGSLRERLTEEIARDRLPVRLLGQRSESEMTRLYAAADLFVLPSLSDPSPLSAVEACAARLPLLVSTAIGNFPDVLEEGVNGWGFDPARPEAQRERVRAIAALSPAELAAMGARSGEVYRRRFDSGTCVARVGEFLRATHARLRAARG